MLYTLFDYLSEKTRLKIWPFSHILYGLLAIFCVACTPVKPGEELFPLAEGRHWTYRITTESTAGAVPVKQLRIANLGPLTLGDLSTWLRRSDDGANYYLQSDATGIHRVATRFELEEAATLDKAKRYVLMAPYTVGTNWRHDTTTYLLERRQEFPRELRHTHPKIPMVYTIDAVGQKVKTLGGEFDGCTVVKGIATLRLFVDPVMGWKDVPLLSTEWFCQGVGLVKLTREERVNSTFLNGGELTMELEEWK